MPVSNTTYSSRVSGTQTSSVSSSSQKKQAVDPDKQADQKYDESRMGLRADLKNFEASKIEQAIANAKAMGSGIVEMNNGGDSVFFEVQQLQNWGYGNNQNTGLVKSGEVPEPNEFDFLDQNADPVFTQQFTARTQKQTLGMTRSTTGGGAVFDQNRLMLEMLTTNRLKEEASVQKQKARQVSDKMDSDSRRMMMLLAMGDIPGLMREMIRSEKEMNRLMISQYVRVIGTIQKAQSRTVRQMATLSPPLGTGTTDPRAAAREQKRAADVTHKMTLLNQSMSALADSGREARDGLSKIEKWMNENWEHYKQLFDEHSRTNSRLTS